LGKNSMAIALLSSALCGLGFTQFAKKSGEIGVLGERRYAYGSPNTQFPSRFR
jgi:hypothetical protein